MEQARTRGEPRVRSGETQEGQASKAQQAAAEAQPQDIKATADYLASRFGVKVELTEDEDSGRSVVRIMSNDGERILRQMPPEAAIDLAERARKGSAESLLDSMV